MNIARIYEIVIGSIGVLTGVALILYSTGYLPRSPSAQRAIEAKQWRDKYKSIVWIAAPIVIIYGVTRIIKASG